MEPNGKYTALLRRNVNGETVPYVVVRRHSKPDETLGRFRDRILRTWAVRKKVSRIGNIFNAYQLDVL